MIADIAGTASGRSSMKQTATAGDVMRTVAGVLLFAGLLAQGAASQPALKGRVIDADTRAPIVDVTITMDGHTVRFSDTNGGFDFGAPAGGAHEIVFNHVAYEPRTIRIEWPRQSESLVVELQPIEFTVEGIEVQAERTLPSLPVSTISFDREATVLTPGNIANDPFRTLQSHPSATSAGIDFLSTMAVRGGNTEEHRVYYDNFPLRHYVHVGGFASVVYDDMLENTMLLPGAAPIRYKGALSGVILLTPGVVDTNDVTLRYDISSMAGGVTYHASPSLVVQASAKSDFFNLPVYQQLGVEERAFKDAMARAVARPNPTTTITPTVLAAYDREEGTPIRGTAQTRETRSGLAGAGLVYEPDAWRLEVRPWYSYFESRDALTWSQSAREHELNEGHVFAELKRTGPLFGASVSGEFGAVSHNGFGGAMSDTPWALSAELQLLLGETVALVLGGGFNREEWTNSTEPEGYASVRFTPADWLELSGAARRSHQTPFLFSERRYFASIPIDAGELASAYTSSRDEAGAVRMDQVSAEATLGLPLGVSIDGNGFGRWYDNLLTWDWNAFPSPDNVSGGGTGHGYGYELMIHRDDPDFLSTMVAFSQARVWRREGMLTTERLGDFDKPDAWQLGGTLKLSRKVHLSARYTDVAGRPYTQYDYQSTPPSTDQVNAERLPRFRRLDVKLTIDIEGEVFNGTFFVDIVNFLNRHNIAATYALEVTPGEFVTVPYGGTRFFPIGGITLRI